MTEGVQRGFHRDFISSVVIARILDSLTPKGVQAPMWGP